MANGLFRTPEQSLAERRQMVQQLVQNLNPPSNANAAQKIFSGLGQMGLSYAGMKQGEQQEEALANVRGGLEERGREQADIAATQERNRLKAMGGLAPQTYSDDVFRQQAEATANVKQEDIMSSDLDKSVKGALLVEDALKSTDGTPESIWKAGQNIFRSNPDLGMALMKEAKALQGVDKAPEGELYQIVNPEGKVVNRTFVAQGDAPDLPEGFKLQKIGIGSDRAEDDLLNVGNALYSVKKGQWIVPPKNPALAAAIPIKTIDENGNNVTQLVDKTSAQVMATFPAQKEVAKLANNVQKDQLDSLDLAQDSFVSETRINEVLGKLERLPDFGGGLPLTVEDIVKDNLGLRDAKSEATTLARGLMVGEAVQFLPPGPASDKDIALVLSGQPPENAGKEEWLSYFRGAKKLARMTQNYYKDKAQFISNYNGIRGFSQLQEAKALDAAIVALPTRADGATPLDVYNSLPKGSPEQREAKAQFTEKYGFDPERRVELASALTNLGL